MVTYHKRNKVLLLWWFFFFFFAKIRRLTFDELQEWNLLAPTEKPTLEWQRKWDYIANDLSTVDGRFCLSPTDYEGQCDIMWLITHMAKAVLLLQLMLSSQAPSATLQANIKKPLFHDRVNFLLWQLEVRETTGCGSRNVWLRHESKVNTSLGTARYASVNGAAVLGGPVAFVSRIKRRFCYRYCCAVCIHHYEKAIQIHCKFPPLPKMYDAWG